MIYLGRSSRPTSGEALPGMLSAVCAVCLLSVLSAAASAALSVSAPCPRQLLAISRVASPVLSEEERRNTRRSSRGLLVSVVIADRSEGIESLLLTLPGSTLPLSWVLPSSMRSPFAVEASKAQRLFELVQFAHGLNNS